MQVSVQGTITLGKGCQPSLSEDFVKSRSEYDLQSLTAICSQMVSASAGGEINIHTRTLYCSRTVPWPETLHEHEH